MFFSYMYKRSQRSLHMQRIYEFYLAGDTSGGYGYFNALSRAEQETVIAESLEESNEIIRQAIWLDMALSSHTES